MEKIIEEVDLQVDSSGEAYVEISLEVTLKNPGQTVVEFEIPFPLKLVDLGWGQQEGAPKLRLLQCRDVLVAAWGVPWDGNPPSISVKTGHSFAPGDKLHLTFESDEGNTGVDLNLGVLTRSYTDVFDSEVVDVSSVPEVEAATMRPILAPSPTEPPPIVHELPFHINGLEITVEHLERGAAALRSVEGFLAANVRPGLSDKERSILLGFLGAAAAKEAEEGHVHPLKPSSVAEAYEASLFGADALREAALDGGFPLLKARPTEEEWGEIRAFLVKVADLKPQNTSGGLTISETLKRARAGLRYQKGFLVRMNRRQSNHNASIRTGVLTVSGFISTLDVMLGMADHGTHAMKRRFNEMLLAHINKLREVGDKALKHLADGDSPIDVHEFLLTAIRRGAKTDMARRLHELQAENKHLRAGFARLGHHAEDVITASRAREEGIPAMEDYEKTQETDEPIPF